MGESRSWQGAGQPALKCATRLPRVTAATLVVPCYNEATRLDVEALRDALGRHDWALVLVNDGSTDDTQAVLERLRQAAPDRVTVHAQARNSGKAEAVRQGLLLATATGAPIVGYLDADLATPPDEMQRIVEALRESGRKVALGSRVALLGSDIARTAVRHYLGRVFATGASLALGLRVYDTQCGAKVFVNTPQLRAALAAPFSSRWIFDVELLSRLLSGEPPLGPADFLEVPLHAWRDVRGSKLRPTGMLRAGLDLVAFGVKNRR